MYDTQSPSVAIEEYAIPATVARDNPFLWLAALERRHEHVSLDAGPPYLACSHEFHDAWFGGNAPTLAARPRVATLIPGVDIQAKRGHVRHHLKPDRPTQKSRDAIAAPNLIRDYKTEGARLVLGQDR
jgi:hypothetical protein